MKSNSKQTDSQSQQVKEIFKIMDSDKKGYIGVNDISRLLGIFEGDTN